MSPEEWLTRAISAAVFNAGFFAYGYWIGKGRPWRKHRRTRFTRRTYRHAIKQAEIRAHMWWARYTRGYWYETGKPMRHTLFVHKLYNRQSREGKA